MPLALCSPSESLNGPRQCGPSTFEEKMTHELLVVGLSDNVFAEYSYRADAPFTWLELWDGEVISVKGYSNKAEMLADAVEAESFGCPVQRFFIEQ
jgi:hypothetical protein